MKENEIKGLIKHMSKHEDVKVFEKLFFHYYDDLYRFAFRYLQQRELAEEVVSDVFMSIWQKRQSFSEVKNLKVYLYVITKNHALNYLKKNSKSLLFFAHEVQHHDVSTTDNPESKLLNDELRKEIDAAIDELPDRCKEVFQLVRLDGLKYKEVAEILDISVKTVENQLRIAVQRLSSQLIHHFKGRQRKNTLKAILVAAAVLGHFFILF